jgi:hypothetical protein
MASDDEIQGMIDGGSVSENFDAPGSEYFGAGSSGSGYGGGAGAAPPAGDDDDDSSGPGLISQILSSRRVGMMAARAGIRSLEEEMKTQSAERDAADSGNTDEYIKLHNQEMSGATGYLRSGLKGITDDLASPANRGVHDAVSALTFGEIDPRANDASEADIEQGAKQLQGQQNKLKADKYDEALDKKIGAMNESANEEATQGSADREQMRRKYEYGQKMAEADRLSLESQDKFGGRQNQDRIVAGMRAAAGREEGIGEMNAEQEQDRRVQGLEHEAKDADMEMSGDYEGARRDKFMQGLDSKSQEEHGKSQKEGDIFDSQVKPELIKQYDQQVAQMRAEDEQKAQDEVTKIQQQAQNDRLRAQGDSYQAERAAKFASLDEQVAKAQQAADAERDAFKKGQLQQVADAMGGAAASEKGSYDLGHDREDDVRAREMAMKFSGDDQGAANLGASEEYNKTGNKKVYDEQLKESQYRADQEQRERDSREKESGDRASGQGELADYEGLRGREDENIRKAELSGDPNRIAQTKRTAANDIQAYEKEHQEKGHMYNSTEEFANHLMFAGSDGGRNAALNMAARDAGTLRGGGDLHDKQHGAADAHSKAADAHGSAAKELQAAAKAIQAALSKSAKFTVADIT